MLTFFSYGLIGLGISFLILGIYGIFRYNDFYTRILIASKVDTCGFLLIAFGIALLHGFSFFTGKLLLICLILVIVNPFVTAIMVKSAFDDNAMRHPEGAEDEDLPLSDEEKSHLSIDGPWV